nr:alpha/beta hydrolase [uncultured Desulfuromonas sp.]
MTFLLGHRLPFCLCLLLLLCACQPGLFSRLKRNLRDMESHGVIAGQLIRPNEHAPVYLSLLDSQGACIDTIRFTSDRYALFAPLEHDYQLVAFQDLNGDGYVQVSEPIASTCDDPALFLTAQQRNQRRDLSLQPSSMLPPQLVQACPPQEETPMKIRLIVGDVADFNRPEFGQSFARKGLWAPVDFLREAGIGIYFLEAYDPDKIPVLFINGAAGSPLDWQAFYQRMDKTRYQAWFYFYPSGLPLKQLSQALSGMTRNLQERYGFKHMAVVAHSMGGLIGRGFLMDETIRHKNFVDVFVSISTPWEGIEAANLGVKYAPAAIPSWYDVATDSPYQKTIFERTLPRSLSYYLLFGYSDTAVPLKSQLYTPAQHEAERIIGYNEGHVSILSSPQVIEDLFRLLDEQW